MDMSWSAKKMACRLELVDIPGSAEIDSLGFLHGGAPVRATSATGNNRYALRTRTAIIVISSVALWTVIIVLVRAVI
jgi:hypothetical protein